MGAPSKARPLGRTPLLLLSLSLLLFSPEALGEVLEEEVLSHLMPEPVAPTLRAGVGFGYSPEVDPEVVLDLDISAGVRGFLEHGETIVGLMGELGYAYVDGAYEAAGGNYGTIGVGFILPMNLVSLTFSAALLVGARADLLDLGARIGVRLELAMLGLEADYQYRENDVNGCHGLHVVFSIDLARAILPLILARGL